jgi:iron(III) transport system substrate-binding protein
MKAIAGILVVLLFPVGSVCLSFSADAPGIGAWEPLSEIEAAARKEGKLVIYSAGGHANRETQQAISDIFTQRYGVSIAWTTVGAADARPRILAEQRTKLHVLDIFMSGTAGNYSELKSRGYIRPILAPSTLEKNVWLLDPAMAFPNDRDWLYIYMPVIPAFFVNTDLVPPGAEPKSYRDLIQPKWKGKLVMQTPAKGGSASGWFRAMHRPLGLDYMRALAKQVTLVSGTNDHAYAVARGQYPVAVAVLTQDGLHLMKERAPVKYVHAEEGAFLTNLGIYFIANAPHPNAAKLFLQWFFSREGQTVYARNSQVVPLRKDVAQDYLPASMRYVQGQRLIAPLMEELSGEKAQELINLGKQIFEEGK